MLKRIKSKVAMRIRVESETKFEKKKKSYSHFDNIDDDEMIDLGVNLSLTVNFFL